MNFRHLRLPEPNAINRKACAQKKSISHSLLKAAQSPDQGSATRHTMCQGKIYVRFTERRHFSHEFRYSRMNVRVLYDVCDRDTFHEGSTISLEENIWNTIRMDVQLSPRVITLVIRICIMSNRNFHSLAKCYLVVNRILIGILSFTSIIHFFS